MEPRRVDHQLRKFEFPVPEEAAKPELASDDDIPDAGEIDDGDSDSDMSALEDEDSDSGSSEGILEEEMVNAEACLGQGRGTNAMIEVQYFWQQEK